MFYSLPYDLFLYEPVFITNNYFLLLAMVNIITIWRAWWKIAAWIDKRKNIKQKKYQPIKNVFGRFARTWKGRRFTFNEHTRFKLSGKVKFLWQLSEIGSLLLILVWEIGALVLFSYVLN